MDDCSADLCGVVFLGVVAHAQSGTGCADTASQSTGFNGFIGDGMPRIHWSIRYLVFALSTFTLSLFFAGWREINTTMHASGFVLLSAGVLLTGVLLMLQGYWIYFEEKNKGSLRKTSKFFEAIHKHVEAKYSTNKFVRMLQPQIAANQNEVPNNR